MFTNYFNNNNNNNLYYKLKYANLQMFYEKSDFNYDERK